MDFNLVGKYREFLKNEIENKKKMNLDADGMCMQRISKNVFSIAKKTSYFPLRIGFSTESRI